MISLVYDKTKAYGMAYLLCLGIGAGAGCSGQVQVVHDISGMFHKFLPKFSKRYRLVGPQIEAAIASYKQDVSVAQLKNFVCCENNQYLMKYSERWSCVVSGLVWNVATFIDGILSSQVFFGEQRGRFRMQKIIL